MASSTSHRLLARLQRDLAELREQPYPGVAVFTDDADIRTFCLVLTPPAGPWKGLALHFDVTLPPSWPSDPPLVSSSVHDIDHPNFYGSYICCDLLKSINELPPGYSGGYTPAFTLRGLFLQFLTFFSSTSVEQDYGGFAVKIGEAYDSTYFLEKDLASAQYLWGRCRRGHNPCTCKPSRESQVTFERQWKADSRPEITINPPGGLVADKVKATDPHPDRIHKLDKPSGRWQSTYHLIHKWSCKKCPYGSAGLPQRVLDGAITTRDAVDVPANILDQSPTHCVLHLLNDDALLEIASQMQSETLITFGYAYPRFHHLISGHHVFLLRELHCFFLKTPLNQGVIGIGVAYEPGSRTMSSDFDWLSFVAFKDYCVRTSIQKRPFQYFLPLAFNRGHFDRARSEIWRHVELLDTAVRQADIDRQSGGNFNGRGRGGGRGRGHGRGRGRGGPPAVRVIAPRRAHPHQVFEVLYKMMNNIVVALMKSCDDALAPNTRRLWKTRTLLNASEKAVISYCHLMHLLMCVCRVEPAVLQDANQRIHSFLQNTANRTKTHTPDMGELIVAITLVLIMTPPDQTNRPTRSMINGPFLEEAIIRNVRWVLKDAPDLEIMEEGANDYRLATTFLKSKTSLRLIMFQITFLDMFIKTYHTIGTQALDSNYGFPESHLPGKMVEQIKEIYKVETWPGFFGKVHYERATGPEFSKANLTEMLRAAVKTSGERGYHDTARTAELDRLRPIRWDLERAWNEAQTGR